MSYYLKIFARRESYSNWFRTDSFTIENDTCLEIDHDDDLSIKHPGRTTYLITFSKIRDRFDWKYVFYNGSKIIYRLEIDFSEIGPLKHDFDIIENIKKEYVAKYKPEFERMLEQIKVRIEQDNVKKLLDNI